MEIFSLGIDPDTHHTALALTSTKGIKGLAVVEVGSKHKGQMAVAKMIEALAMTMPTWLHRLKVTHLAVIVAEGQQIYAGGKTKNWSSILKLGPITGAAAALARSSTLALVKVPTPMEWRGSIPKDVMQARVLTKRGIDYTMRGTGKARYCIPEVSDLQEVDGARLIKPTGWKHVVDAIGLADWGLKQVAEERIL